MQAGDIRKVLRVGEGEGGERLDRFLEFHLELSRSQVKRLIDKGLVIVDGSLPKKAGIRVKEGQIVIVEIPTPEPLELVPVDAALVVYYEDDYIAVVEKPAGVPVHPSPGHSQDTLANVLIAHFPVLSQMGGRERPGIVHRLDKDTSGLLVVAKREDAHRAFSEMLQKREITKIYVAVCRGVPGFREGKVEAPIGRHPVDRKRMAVVSGGREALTRYRVIDAVDGYSLLGVRILTGRTHQIRVHLHHIGVPVLGDPLYGRRGLELIGRQALHAAYMAFRHPITGEHLSFFSKVPEDLVDLLRRLGLRIPSRRDLEPLV